MLDITLTNLKYGGLHLNLYRPKVVVKCDKCGKISTYTIRVKSKVKDNNINWVCPKCVSNRIEVKDKLSEKTKESWKKQEYRGIITNSSISIWKNEEYKHKHSVSVNTDESKKKCSDASKRAWSDKKYRELRIEQVKRKWVDPIYKNLVSNSMINFYKIIEHRQMASINSKKIWENSDYREKMAIARQNSPNCDTKIELILCSILDDLKIRYQKQYRVGFYLFDCFLSDYNILIECNGDYWHSLPKGIRNDKSKSTYINKYFPNYKLYSIWEHEFKCMDKIKNLICYWIGYNDVNIDFEFKDIIIKYDVDIDVCKLFLSKYHYLNTVGNNSIRIGAYINDNLIGLCIYGALTRKESADKQGYNSKEMLELTRFCIHPNYHKKNFASWLISRTINYVKKLNRYKCLISFADSTFNHTGCIYKSSNWILDGVLNPDYWYVDNEGYVMHKRTLYSHAVSLKLKEAEFVSKYNYIKVYGKEKYRYIYRLR